MNFITRKSLSRRTALKGVGATFALPLLDAMIPAATAEAKTPARHLKRLGYVFMPMGCDQSRWTPRSKNTLEKLPPILDSLAPVKDKRYVRGLHRLGDRWMHISKGVGNLHGVRLNCRPEVSLLNVS